MNEEREELTASGRLEAPRIVTPIVPRNSISGRALVAVVAIMTFLASLTTGGVMLVRGSASEWQSDIAREVTIQIRPAADRDLEAATNKAAEIARKAAGVSDVRVYTKDESAKLLEPWLGTGLTLEELPVPRILAVRLSGDGTDKGVDLAPLRQALADQVTGATLDDHRAWNERMRTMATATITAGLGLLALMLAATILSVTFATRGAMAATRTVIEVLHFVGAKNDYIAARFQRHFLTLGLQGGALGGGAAMLIFAIAGLLSRSSTGDEASALFGSLSIGLFGYIAIAVIVTIIASITALTSRHTVNRTLAMID